MTMAMPATPCMHSRRAGDAAPPLAGVVACNDCRHSFPTTDAGFLACVVYIEFRYANRREHCDHFELRV